MPRKPNIFRQMENEWSQYESQIASRLELMPFLKWKNRKTYNLCKKLFKQKVSVNEAVKLVVLSS